MARSILTYCIILLFQALCVAQVRVGYQTTESHVVPLDHFVTYYLDSTGKATAAEMPSHLRQQAFHQLPEPVPNFTGFDGTVWISFTIENNDGHAQYVEFTNAYLQDIRIYRQEQGGEPLLIHHTGTTQPFSSRGIAGIHYLLPISLNEVKCPVTIFGAIRTIDQPFWVRARIGELKPLLADLRQEELLVLALIGMAFVMLLYNACLGLMTRDITYAYYVAYVFAAINYLLYSTGFLFEWLWPDQPGHNSTGRFAVGFLYFTWLLFVNNILEVRRTQPTYHKLSLILIAYTAIVCLSNFTDPLPMGYVYVMNLTVPAYLIIIVTRRILDRDKIVYLFMIGWIPLMISSVFFSLMMQGMFYSEFARAYLVAGAMVWETAVFSLTLGYRFNVIRAEHMAIQLENIQIIENQRRVLELKVSERTQQLSKQNQKLLRQQEENRSQRNLIEAHNRNLEAAVEQRTQELAKSNEMLKLQVHKLEQFNFIIAHNLRSPVARLLGLANIFNRTNLSDPTNLTVLNKTVEASRDLDSIIGDLNQIISTQDVQMEKTTAIDLGLLTDGLRTRFEPETVRFQIDFRVHIGMPVLYSVPGYVDNILCNLISNCISHRAPDRLPWIELSFYPVSGYCQIIVKDNGKGFNMDQHAGKIFEPFQRFDAEHRGKGLGLFLIKSQVTSLGGTVAINSKVNIGTQVEILIPNREPDEDKLASPVRALVSH
ncbi:MAG TPA: sensor histidine kinase [Cyclobacteriaceae bacterium]|nr:sensor histidine kinase [Cyclobacteriaceae bacterium]